MITQDEVKQILHYDPDTGIFTWKIEKANRVKVGMRAGRDNGNGYLIFNINGKKYFSHRIAWLYMTGQWSKKYIDHINGNKSDNRFCNLREATHQQNITNQINKHKNNKSGYMGVSFDKSKGKYRAQITVNGRTRKLGWFKEPIVAHEAYLKAKRELHEFCTI